MAQGRRVLPLLVLAMALGSCGQGYKDEEIQDQALRMLLPETGGRIGGDIYYPKPELPEDLEVCAESILEGTEDCNSTRVDDTYIMDLPAGDYLIFSRTGERPGVKAYFTRAVPCGLTPECNDHTPITITIKDGDVFDGINPVDWIAGG